MEGFLVNKTVFTISAMQRYAGKSGGAWLGEPGELSLGRKLTLGLQHMVAMFGATILVAILVGGYFGGEVNIGQVTLLGAGLGTLLFHAVTHGQVPAFLGSSFAFLGGFATIANMDSGRFAGMSYAEKYSYACGGIVVAGLLYLVLAGVIRVAGAKRVMRFFPPVVTGPIILCIGMSLVPSALNNCAVNWPLAIFAFLVVVVLNIWGKGLAKITAILIGVVCSYLVAAVLQMFGVTNADGSALIETARITGAAVVGLPKFYMAKFDLSAILVMAPIAVATMMEHVGDISAISETVGHNFIEKPGLNRTLLGDGLATAMVGFFGGPANTTYGENTGVLVLSGVHDPSVIRVAAIYAVVMAFSPWLSGVFTAMPTAIIGGISLILYGMISAVGIRNMVENRVDFTKSRNLIVTILILIAGIGTMALSANEVSGITLTFGETHVTITWLALAAVVGVVSNAILPGKDYEFGVNPEGDVSHGLVPPLDAKKS